MGRTTQFDVVALQLCTKFVVALHRVTGNLGESCIVKHHVCESRVVFAAFSDGHWSPWECGHPWTVITMWTQQTLLGYSDHCVMPR